MKKQTLLFTVKSKFILVLLVSLVLGASSSHAQTLASTPAVNPLSPEIPGLDKPIEQITETDLKAFVELAYSEQITIGHRGLSKLDRSLLRKRYST
jgi:hypothetical protein